MITLLKRYSNRRLYDTRLSRYITLEDLAARIRRGEEFQVLDSDSGRDLTRRVMLQVVLLENLDLADVLPVEFLRTVIRLHDRRVQDLFIRYLKLSMEGFAFAQRQLEESVRLVQDQMSVTAQVMRTFLPFPGVGGPGEGSPRDYLAVDVPPPEGDLEPALEGDPPDEVPPNVATPRGRGKRK